MANIDNDDTNENSKQNHQSAINKAILRTLIYPAQSL
jgi:hypothetical protein